MGDINSGMQEDASQILSPAYSTTSVLKHFDWISYSVEDWLQNLMKCLFLTQIVSGYCSEVFSQSFVCFIPWLRSY